MPAAESLSWASWEILLFVGPLMWMAVVKLELQEHKFLVCHSVVGNWNTASYSGLYKMQKKGGITRKYEWMVLFIKVYDIYLIWVMSRVYQSRGNRRHFEFKLLTLLMSFVGNSSMAPFPFYGYLCNKCSKMECSGILLSSGYMKQMRFLGGCSLPRQSEGSFKGGWELS